MFRRFLDLVDIVPRSESLWYRFNLVFAGTLAAAGGLALFLVYLVDPWGLMPFSIPMERPIVDIMQRHLYPMVVRSGRYDSLVIGNSTIRLLDPTELHDALGGTFANLAMNDGRAYEQWKIADLFLREIGKPKILIVGMDGVWCHPEADTPKNRITRRGFPEWIYDENPWNDLLHVFSGRSVEFAVRMILTKAGLRPKRLEDNGYAVFVPPKSEYDLARAREHIWGEGLRDMPPVDPPVTLTQEEAAALVFPAHAWLDDLVKRTAGTTEFILAWMPVHFRSQPAVGSRDAAVEEVCKTRVDALAKLNGALAIDWRIPSMLTMDDGNYWDSLHYRLPIASRIVKSFSEAKQGRLSGAKGIWVVRTASNR